MTRFIDRIRSDRRKLLWLDATTYTERLLVRGAAPWLDAAGYVAWQRKARSLLNSDVIGVPILRIATAYVQANDSLKSAMGAKQRTLFPLKTLLADEGLRELAATLVADVRATFADQILALVMPTPSEWIGVVYALAHGSESSPDIDADDAESAATYLADFLRIFAESGIDILLLEHAATAQAASLDDTSYTPLVNLAEHYRWSIGVRAAVITTTENSRMNFAITTSQASLPITGIEIATEFWSGAAMPTVSSSGFVFAAIPMQAEPERVMEYLAVLRKWLAGEQE